MYKYEFWIDQGEVKNEEDFQTPDAVATASSVEEAAVLAVPELIRIDSSSFYEVVVRNTTTNRWFTLGLSKLWAVTESKEKTFSEILKDFES